ncbi:MAG: carbohydrate binding domain-containing protein [Blastocatellia bacterium]
MSRLLFIVVLVGAVFAGRSIYRGFVAESLLAWGDDRASRDAALASAPANPAVIAARAKYIFYRAETPDEEMALSELRRAVRLSPFDYRYWLELGRAAENHGDAAAALALDRARTLAPGYFETHWTWANFKLRNGETEDAIAAFHHALLISENRPGVTNGRAALNVYDALAQALGLDPEMLRRVAPADENAQSYLAYYYATRGALGPAMEIFRRLTLRRDSARQELITELLRCAEAAGQYDVAGEVWNGLREMAGVADQDGRDNNLIENGGFERIPLSEEYPQLLGSGLGFDWLMPRHAEVAVRRDDERPHTGQRALLVSFEMGMTTPFANLAQVVRVEPGRRYRLSFYVRASNVPSEPPSIEITDAKNPDGITHRLGLPREAGDWQEQTLDFTTLPETRAIRILLRSPVYSDLGRELGSLNRVVLHLDDFSLVRID